MQNIYEEIEKLIPDSKRPSEGADSHQMAECVGWNDCVLEMHKRSYKLIAPRHSEEEANEEA